MLKPLTVYVQGQVKVMYLKDVPVFSLRALSFSRWTEAHFKGVYTMSQRGPFLQTISGSEKKKKKKNRCTGHLWFVKTGKPECWSRFTMILSSVGLESSDGMCLCSSPIQMLWWRPLSTTCYMWPASAICQPHVGDLDRNWGIWAISPVTQLFSTLRSMVGSHSFRVRGRGSRGLESTSEDTNTLT